MSGVSVMLVSAPLYAATGFTTVLYATSELRSSVFCEGRESD